MKILLLCTYPIENPMHGGQLRVRNIVDIYRAAGHEVEVAGVLGSEQYEGESGFVPYPGLNNLAKIISNPFLMEDYAIGRLFSTDEKYYNSLSKLVRYDADVIHIEQPWLFAFAERLRSDRMPLARLIYGSQNIEFLLKNEILKTHFKTEDVDGKAAIIKNIELNAIHNSEFVVCVSENDASFIQANTDNPVILAPNGVKAWVSSSEGRQEANTITQGYRYALYCGSAHPPNVKGFFDMFGGGFGSLKPDEKLVIAGGAGWSIASDLRVHQSPKLAEKVIVAGFVSQQCLDGLLDCAHCIVLPLTQGGGTNLKTAEALWSGKHVVATSVSMRGFEKFIGERGVIVEDDPRLFKSAIRKAMALDQIVLTPEEIEIRRSVLWDHCLSSLPVMLSKLEKKVSI